MMKKAVSILIFIFCGAILMTAKEQPAAFISVLKPQEYLGAKVPVQLEVILKEGQTATFPEQLTLPDGLESAGKSALTSLPWEGKQSISTQIYYVMAMDSGYFEIAPQAIKISQKGGNDTTFATDSASFRVQRIKVKEQDNPLEIIPPMEVKTGISLLWIYIPGGILFASICVALFLYLRRSKKPVSIIPKGANPYQWSISELTQLQKTLPWQNKDQSKKFELVYDILRAYIHSEITNTQTSYTTEELSIHLAKILPEVKLQLLLKLLADCDSIKFAKFTAEPDLQEKMLAQAIASLDDLAQLKPKEGGSRG